MKVISDLLASKYGPSFAEACRVESIETISSKLKHKLSIQSPPKLLVEKYVIEIAKSYNIPYEPDSQIMDMEKGILYCILSFRMISTLCTSYTHYVIMSLFFLFILRSTLAKFIDY